MLKRLLAAEAARDQDLGVSGPLINVRRLYWTLPYVTALTRNAWRRADTAHGYSTIIRRTDMIPGYGARIRSTDIAHGNSAHIHSADTWHGCLARIRLTDTVHGYIVRLRRTDMMHGYDTRIHQTDTARLLTFSTTRVMSTEGFSVRRAEEPWSGSTRRISGADGCASES